MKRQVKPSRPIYPTPAGLVTSVRADGSPNIITLAEICNLSIGNPVVVGLGIAPERLSYELIEESREFVVNLPSADILEKVDRCGSMSGRDIPNKFEAAGLTPVPASVVRPPLIAECPVNLECRLIRIDKNIGDHDLFIGEVVAQHIDEECLSDDGRILIDNIGGLAYVLGEYWTLGERLGRHGFSGR